MCSVPQEAPCARINIFQKFALGSKSFDYRIKFDGKSTSRERNIFLHTDYEKKHSPTNMPIYSDELREATHVLKSFGCMRNIVSHGSRLLGNHLFVVN